MFFTIAVITVAYGLLMRIVDPHDFPTVGLAIWWAADTVTTIGYGDVVPTTHFGRLVAAGLMIFGFASLSLSLRHRGLGLRAPAAGGRTPHRTSRDSRQRLVEIERLLREKS